MAEYPYGIDPSGDPVVSGGGDWMCPDGYQWDEAQQTCVRKLARQSQPSTDTASQPSTDTAAPVTPPGTYTVSADALTAFLNANPSLTGQAAVDAFAKAYPQFAGEPAWYPDTQTYGLHDYYLVKDPTTGQWGPVRRVAEQNAIAGFLGAWQPTTPAPAVQTPPYTPTQYAAIPPFQPGPSRGQTDLLLSQLLQSGGALGPEAVARLRADQQATIAAGSEAARQAILQNAANRGMLPSGVTAANLAAVDTAQLGQLSQAYRDIATAAAQTNFANQLQALAAGTQAQQQTFDEYLRQQGLTQAQQAAQAAENQFAWQAARQAQQDALNNWLASQGFGLQAYMSGLPWAQLAESARQYNLGNQLMMLQFLAG